MTVVNFWKAGSDPLYKHRLLAPILIEMHSRNLSDWFGGEEGS